MLDPQELARTAGPARCVLHERPMREQFWLSCAVFHVLLCAVIGVQLRRRSASLARGERPSRRLVADGFVFAAVTLILAWLGAAFVTPTSPFTVLRLLAQALFGEAILYAAALGWMLRRHAHTRWAAAMVVLSVAGLAVYWQAYHREPKDLQVSAHEIDLAHGRPAGHLRILHLTDLQTDWIGAYEDHAIRQALAQKPDLIVMTGDYIQPRLEPTRSRATRDLKALLRRRHFQAPLGVYAVRGDVDADWPGVLAGTGVRTLTGEVARISLPDGATLSVVGLTVAMSRGQADGRMVDFLRQVPDDDLRIVIGHQPNFVTALAGKVPLDLALAGHTRGGQVVLPFFGAPITKTRLPRRFASGLGDYEGVPLHVSAGIGMERGTAPQIRFLCPPEICVLDLRYARRAPGAVIARGGGLAAAVPLKNP